MKIRPLVHKLRDPEVVVHFLGKSFKKTHWFFNKIGFARCNVSSKNMLRGRVFSSVFVFDMHQKKSQAQKNKNIIIFRTDLIGDFVMSTALIQNVINKFPNSNITFVCSNKNYKIAKLYNIFDKIIVFGINFSAYCLGP